MKKIIVLLAVLLLPGFALAETVNVFDAGGGNKLIYRMTDNGEVRTSIIVPGGYKGSYVEFDDRGNSRLINDFSRDDGWGDRRGDKD